MQPIYGITKKCLQIKPNSSISSVMVVFDYQCNQPLITVHSKNSFQMISNNMKSKCDCPHFRGNLISAIYPDHTYYHMFYESRDQSLGKPFNKIGTRLLNNVDLKCYGNCFIVHYDAFYELYDIDKNTFVKAYNTKYPITKSSVKNHNTADENCHIL